MFDHCQRYAFCRVTYWKDNTASSTLEDWTHCKVTPLGAHTYGEQSFKNSSEEIYRRDALLAFLEMAYESGRHDAKREIRDVLGVKGTTLMTNPENPSPAPTYSDVNPSQFSLYTVANIKTHCGFPALVLPAMDIEMARSLIEAYAQKHGIDINQAVLFCEETGDSIPVLVTTGSEAKS